MEISQYERFARIDQKHWWFIARRKVVATVLKSTFERNGQRLDILDVGTGSGGMIAVLKPYGDLVVTEPDDQQLRFTKEKYSQSNPDVEFVHSGWEDFDPGDRKFDLITAFDVLEHCRDDRQALSKWRSWLKEEGTLLLTVPAFASLWGINDELSHHYRRYTSSTLTQALLDTFFAIDSCSYMNALMFVPVWISRNVKDRIDRFFARGDAPQPWDFGMPPAPINFALEKLFSCETSLLPHMSLPFGTSVICVAHRVPPD